MVSDERTLPQGGRGSDQGFLTTWRETPESARARLLGDYVCELAAEFLELPEDDPVSERDKFLDLGFDSLRAVDFKILVETRLGCALESTVLFDCPTPASLVESIAHALAEPEQAPRRIQEGRRLHAQPSRDELAELPRERLIEWVEQQSARLAALEEARSEPIAIVALSCRFPGGADDPEAFWRMQCEGVDAIAEVPASRWDVDRHHDPDPAAPGRMYTRWGGWLSDVEHFDARFFGISPREASQLDPQQRLLLEVTWEALERGGLSPQRMRGSPTGVFIGTRGAEYFQGQTHWAPEDAGTYYASGNSSSTLAGRLSYHFGWSGPCYALDTACSSSLVAVHAASQSLRRGECSAAVAGGVNLVLDPFGTISLCKASMLSPEGRCRTFDAGANGYVRSEGVGVVVLKRLSRAQADGDEVLALVRGTAINQDGASGGLTVPNGAAQQAVIRQALSDAGLRPDEIDYVEAHGTGTSLGDPIEVAALDAVFAPERQRPLQVGSVKTNIGHGETAAGIAGLIRVVQALGAETLPRHLHLQTPNPHIPWERSVVEVVCSERGWARSSTPRRAGVNSFGFSGTNAHVVLEEAPSPVAPGSSAPSREHEVVCVSAQGEHGLRAQARRLADDLSARPGLALGDVANTLACGRAHQDRRAAFVASSRDELAAKLEELASGARSGSGAAGAAPRVGFLFTGQGSQWAGMGRGLFACEPVFAQALSRAAAVLDALLPAPLFEVLWGQSSGLIGRTDCTQPALFALEYALAELWASLGVRPTWVLGHSVGEYAAAVTAGVLELEDAARLVAARGRLMLEHTSPGSMVAVYTEPERLQEMVAQRAHELSIAAWNCEARLVLSGTDPAVASVTGALRGEGVRCEELDVSHAFHSPLMEPMLAKFEAEWTGVSLRRPNVGFISNLEPGPADEALTSSDYWVRHVREPVRFLEGMRALEDQGCEVLLEVGPAPVLLGMARRFVQAETAWLPSMRPGQDEVVRFAESLARLHELGLDVDWQAWHSERDTRRVLLATQAFQRERHWLPPRTASRREAHGAAHHPLLGAGLELALLQPGERLHATDISTQAPAWLSDHGAFGAPLTPAAAYFETALAAGRELHGAGPLRLDGVSLHAPLFLEESPCALQLVTRPGQEGESLEFELHSRPTRPGPTDEWTLHMRGRLEAPERVPVAADTLDRWRARCQEPADVRELYELFDDVGLHYGPAFRTIESIHVGSDESVAHVRLGSELARELDTYVLHPALLDGCLQSTRVLALARGLEELYLPVGFDGLEVNAPMPAEVLVCAHLRKPEDDARSLVFDLDLFDVEGELRARLEGLQLVRTSRSALLSHADPLKALGHVVEWVEREPRSARAKDAAPRRWVVASEDSTPARSLMAALEREGCQVARFGADALDRRGLRDLLEGSDEAFGLVHLGALAPDPASPDQATDLTREQRLLGETLDMAQSLGLRAGLSPELALVTRGAVAAGGTALPDPGAGCLWGFARTIALEHPDWRVARIDLDPEESDEVGLQRLLTELLSPDGEDQVAWRAGTRRAARLVPRVPRALQGSLELPASEAARLAITQFGVLERLDLVPAARRAPEAGEVELRVAASALNFKDVLAALGLLRASSGIERALEHPLGLECAGTVLRVGDGVTDLSPGDEVLAAARGGMATHVTVARGAVVRKPRGLDLVQAAALPTVALTALYALERCAKLEPGERILVHAAAGGVGQAALQLARALGAEVFATASPPKWEHLRGQGIEHVMNSRDTRFEAQVLAATDGRGVDVVLNCLTGEAIPASLRCLAQGGRFVEIGKLETWSAEQVGLERPDVDFHAFDMADVLADDPELLPELFERLVGSIETGRMGPLPTRSFPVHESVAAFRWLAQARNVGKLVLTWPAQDAQSTTAALRPVSAQGVQLVTGGLGALGLRVAASLVEAGARDLCLLARSAPSEEARERIAELEQRGARVRLAALDVSDGEGLERLIQGFGVPLVGVVHAAGVLDDAVLANLDRERLRTVLVPKAIGLAHLHRLTLDLELDHFVVFSSMVSMVGAAGQGSYAAANAYADALCQHRRGLGLPGLSINWGPWSGAGMAAASEERNRARFAAVGLGSIQPEEGMAVFEKLRGDPRSPAQVGVLPVHWPRYLRQFSRGLPPYFEALTVEQAADSEREDPLLAATLALPLAERRAPLLTYMRAQLARVLGFASAEDVEPARAFVEMGIDSLLAIDLRNRLESDLEIELPVTLAFDHPNLDALAEHVLSIWDEGDADLALLEEIAGLSDDEAERMLAAEEGHD